MRNAKPLEPAHAGRNVTDLIVVDASQEGSAVLVSRTLEPGCHLGRHVETPCFQHQGHDGEPGEQIADGSRRRLPQPVMGRQVAVAGPKVGEPSDQQSEMERLVGGNADPIVEKGSRQRFLPGSRDNVPSEIDCIEFDMGNGVEERSAAG